VYYFDLSILPDAAARLIVRWRKDPWSTDHQLICAWFYLFSTILL